MFNKRSSMVHREVLELRISPAQVREFIMTPARILDYFVGGIDGEVIEPGRSLYCVGKRVILLLEVLSTAQAHSIVTVRAVIARKFEPPFTAERISKEAFFTMLEDWQMEETSTGTRLTKTWRDIKKLKYKWLPVGRMVRRGAIEESAYLIDGWNRAGGARGKF